jgi:hypothetical protein
MRQFPLLMRKSPLRMLCFERSWAVGLSLSHVIAPSGWRA